MTFLFTPNDMKYPDLRIVTFHTLQVSQFEITPFQFHSSSYTISILRFPDSRTITTKGSKTKLTELQKFQIQL